MTSKIYLLDGNSELQPMNETLYGSEPASEALNLMLEIIRAG